MQKATAACGSTMPGCRLPVYIRKGPTVSPFNALVLQLFADRNDYPSAQYVFFHTAKATDIPVLGKEKGVPFNWYAWDNYVNRHDPKDVITASDYRETGPGEAEGIQGVQQRQIRVLFNLAQTVMPHSDADKYRTVLDRYGSSNERGHLKAEERQLRATVNGFIKTDEGLSCADTPVRLPMSPITTTEKDAVYMPEQRKYGNTRVYAGTDASEYDATGHQRRLAREGW